MKYFEAKKSENNYLTRAMAACPRTESETSYADYLKKVNKNVKRGLILGGVVAVVTVGGVVIYKIVKVKATGNIAAVVE